MGFLFYYISYIAPASILIPIVVGSFRYKSLNHTFKVLFWFIVFSAIGNAANILMPKYSIQLFHLYTPFEFAFISLFYNYLFDGRRVIIIGILVALLAIFCYVDYRYIQNGIQVDTYPGTVEGIIIILYSTAYLFKQTSIEHDNSWSQNPVNWINIAFLIYYGCGLFMFMSTNYLIKESLNINLVVWSVFDTILVFESILFAIGLYKCNT